jgi:hypothetical protein
MIGMSGGFQGLGCFLELRLDDFLGDDGNEIQGFFGCTGIQFHGRRFFRRGKTDGSRHVHV